MVVLGCFRARFGGGSVRLRDPDLHPVFAQPAPATDRIPHSSRGVPWHLHSSRFISAKTLTSSENEEGRRDHRRPSSRQIRGSVSVCFQSEIRMLPQPIVDPLRPRAPAGKGRSGLSDRRDPRSRNVQDRCDFEARAQLVGTAEVAQRARLRGSLRSTFAPGLLRPGWGIGSEIVGLHRRVCYYEHILLRADACREPFCVNLVYNEKV